MICDKTLRQFWHTGSTQKMAAVACANGTSIAVIVLNPGTWKMPPRPQCRHYVLCLSAFSKQVLTIWSSLGNLSNSLYLDRWLGLFK